MANVDTGIVRVLKNLDGSTYTGTGIPCFIPSTDSTDIGRGAFVVFSGTSNTANINTLSGQLAGFEDYKIGQLPEVALAAAGANAISGVVVGVAMDARGGTNNNPSYRRASTAAVVWVEPAHNILIDIQSDGAASAHAAVDIGQNINLVTTGTCDTNTGAHEVYLDSTSMGTGATKQFTIVAASRDSDRDELTAAKPGLLCLINNRNLAPNSAGV